MSFCFVRHLRRAQDVYDGVTWTDLFHMKTDYSMNNSVAVPTDHVFKKQREIKYWENELTPLLLFSITVFLSYSVMS